MVTFHPCELIGLVCVHVGWAKPEKPVQRHAAEDPGQQVQLWQLSLLGQLSTVHTTGAVPHPTTHADQSRGTPVHTTIILLLHSHLPFSKFWLLYVKYIYVCIYTVYMYW